MFEGKKQRKKDSLKFNTDDGRQLLQAAAVIGALLVMRGLAKLIEFLFSGLF